jgi:hypothetical protein
MMAGKTIQEAWQKADEIQAQELLSSTTEVSAKRVGFEQIEPADMAQDICRRIQSGLTNGR